MDNGYTMDGVCDHSLPSLPSPSIADIISSNSSLLCTSNSSFLFFITASLFRNFSFSSLASLPALAYRVDNFSFRRAFSAMISCTFRRLSSLESNIINSYQNAFSFNLPISFSYSYRCRNSLPWPDAEVDNTRSMPSRGRGSGSLACDLRDQKLLTSSEYSLSRSYLPILAQTSWSCSSPTLSFRLFIRSRRLHVTRLLDAYASSRCRCRSQQLAMRRSHLACNSALVLSSYPVRNYSFSRSVLRSLANSRWATCSSPNCLWSLNISSSFSWKSESVSSQASNLLFNPSIWVSLASSSSLNQATVSSNSCTRCCAASNSPSLVDSKLRNSVFSSQRRALSWSCSLCTASYCCCASCLR